MFDPVQELKVRAEILHHRAQARDPEAWERLRKLPELRDASPDVLPGASPDVLPGVDRVQRKHCLAVVAREVGFAGWTHALGVLSGDGEETDFGTLLSPPCCAVYLNHWFVDLAEARRHHEARGGYLLAYRRHFVVVDRDYVRMLGLDPEDPDWAAIGRSWVEPASVEARRRLYGKLLARGAAKAA